MVLLSVVSVVALHELSSRHRFLLPVEQDHGRLEKWLCRGDHEPENLGLDPGTVVNKQNRNKTSGRQLKWPSA